MLHSQTGPGRQAQADHRERAKKCQPFPPNCIPVATTLYTECYHPFTRPGLVLGTSNSYWILETRCGYVPLAILCNGQQLLQVISTNCIRVKFSCNTRYTHHHHEVDQQNETENLWPTQQVARQAQRKEDRLEILYPQKTSLL